MSFFTNLRIGTRLACAFALLLLLLLGQVGHALRALHGAEQAGDRLVDHEWAISRALARLDAASRANALATSELLFTRTPAEADAVRSRMATNRQVVTAALNEIGRSAERAFGTCPAGQAEGAARCLRRVVHSGVAGHGGQPAGCG